MPRHVTLAKDRKSAYRIVLGPGADATQRLAARELGQYVRKASGVRLPVSGPDEGVRGPRIVVVDLSADPGAVREALGPAWTKTRAFARDVRAAGPGGCGRAVVGEDVVLAGADRAGVLNSVYGFLHHVVGVRWLDPDPGGESVPRRELIAVQTGTVVEAGAFPMRGIGDGCTVDYRFEDVAWLSRNRVNLFVTGVPQWERQRERFLPELRKRGMQLYVGGHFAHHFFPDPKRYFHAHPEYYALMDGKREPGQICYANPEACQIHLDNILAYAQAHPEIDVLGLWANDGAGFCTCPRCRRQGAKVTMLRFYVRLAHAVRRVRADMQIETGYYLPFLLPLPKSVRFPENTWILYPPYNARSKLYPIYDLRGESIGRPQRNHRRLREELETVVRETPNVMAFPYYSDQIMKKCLYSQFPEEIHEDLVYYRAKGVAGLHDCLIRREGWWMDSLNLYVYARMMWNPHEPLPALLDDYYRGLFGPAADAMAAFDRAYRTLLETPLYHGWRVWDTLDFHFGLQILRMAETFEPDLEAADQAKVADRVAGVRACLAEARKALGSRRGRRRERVERLAWCVGAFEQRLRLGGHNLRVAHVLNRLFAAPRPDKGELRDEAEKRMAQTRPILRKMRRFAREMSRATESPFIEASWAKACRNVETCQRARFEEALAAKPESGAKRARTQRATICPWI